MKNNPGFERFRQARWRRKLTAAEEVELRSFLAEHPEAQADWEAESRLAELLDGLPAPPLPSNFTARVLQAVERENLAGSRAERDGWSLFHWRLRWLPRVAAVALVAGVGLLAWEHELSSKRAAKARAEDLVFVSEVSAVATPELLENFDAIQNLGETASADEDLIRLLQ